VKAALVKALVLPRRDHAAALMRMRQELKEEKVPRPILIWLKASIPIVQ
jgi:hypothetical protein